jgi:hypothetical protein
MILLSGENQNVTKPLSSPKSSNAGASFTGRKTESPEKPIDRQQPRDRRKTPQTA